MSSPLVLEDIEFMVATGESVTIAARRLGRTVEGLEQALRRAGRSDLYRALAAKEGDWNAPSNHAAVVRSDREQRAWAARQPKTGAAA